jgi:hypothetical protein
MSHVESAKPEPLARRQGKGLWADAKRHRKGLWAERKPVAEGVEGGGEGEEVKTAI